ncbi:MAG: sigma-70 family RNA polymerase sigma factor [Pseudomonadota bacterium]
MASIAANRQPDEALIGEMAAGKQDALRAFHQRYGLAVTAVAYRIVGNQADAEEVAADVLWQVWRDSSRFDHGRGSVAGWVMMLARSRAIDRLRARKSREHTGEDLTAETMSDDPTLEIHSAQRRLQVGNALAALKSEERELLELAYFSDLSQSEIAGRTGIALGTVKSRMRTAMIKLRDALKGRVE